MYAWGDNDHGQQGNSTTNVNKKPCLVQGLDGYRITKVACGSSHSVAWATTDVSSPITHEPVVFQMDRDPLGASLLGKNLGLCITFTLLHYMVIVLSLYNNRNG